MKKFLKNFILNNGIWVGSAVLISKVSALLLVIMATNFLQKQAFGEVSSAINFLGFFSAMTGFGSYQGMLRFGAMINEDEKEKLRAYSFSYGLLFQLLLTVVMVVIAAFVYQNEWSLFQLIAIFTIRFFGIFLLEQAKAEARAYFNNKKYALIDIVASLAMLFSGVLLIYVLGKDGYVWALCFSPFIVFLIHRFRVNFGKIDFSTFKEKEFWNFSITTVAGTQIGEWIYLLDIFFITLLLNGNAVADYRVSNTIPMNLLFIAYVFLQTGYPELCKRYQDKTFQKNYLFNYFKTLLPVSLIILFLGFVFSNDLMLLFGKQYSNSSLFRVLLVGAVSVILIRAPFTYVLAALGKPKWNLMISIIMFCLLTMLYYVLIPIYGLIGVAFISVFGLVFSGILYVLAYLYELKRI